MQDICDLNIAFLGCGKMGEAIMAGWLDAKANDAQELSAIPRDNITVVEKTSDRASFIANRYGVKCVTSLSDVEVCDVLVLAIRPQQMSQALGAICEYSAFSNSLFISIAAGLCTDKLQDMLPATSRLVRVMPNLPLLIKSGASALCGSESSNQADIKLSQALFSRIGIVEVVEEDQMDVCTAISGSGPAYVAMMVDALANAGVKNDLPYDVALALALQTCSGTSDMIRSLKLDPHELECEVAVKGGSTIAAIDYMNDKGLKDIYERAVSAAVEKNRELSKL